MLKVTLVLVKIYVLVGKKGISKLSRWVAQKHTSHIFCIVSFHQFVSNLVSISMQR